MIFNNHMTKLQKWRKTSRGNIWDNGILGIEKCPSWTTLVNNGVNRSIMSSCCRGIKHSKNSTVVWKMLRNQESSSWDIPQKIRPLALCNVPTELFFLYRTLKFFVVSVLQTSQFTFPFWLGEDIPVKRTL